MMNIKCASGIFNIIFQKSKSFNKKKVISDVNDPSVVQCTNLIFSQTAG